MAKHWTGPILNLLLPLAWTWGMCACGDGQNATSPNGNDGGVSNDVSGGRHLPCAVDEVLARNCRSCHSNPPSYGAPMPLVTWDDLQARAKTDSKQRVYEMVGKRIHDDAAPMPAKGPLGMADMKTLDGYIAAGAPRSSELCDAHPGDGDPMPLNCKPDMQIAPRAPWAMPKELHDQYVCYGIDVKNTGKRHVVAIAPKVQNRKIVHHALLMQSDQSEDPTPHACNPGGALRWRMLYAWAPGGQNMVMPPEAGFPQEGTTHYVVQIHYNNVGSLENQTDTSGFDVCTTDQLRQNDADVMAFGATNFSIPRQSNYDITCSMTVPLLYPKMHAIFAMPHMHKLGTALVNTLYPAGKSPVDMGTQLTWDFNNQLWYPIDATLKPGDVVKTRCAWTNPTQQPVLFGENTENEMCYAFAVYYPRITLPLFNWATPAGSSTCVPTPR
ncbi:peptidylglycine alpha-amidating monooxygenase [Pendulispora brunnea]|uniref:Peptidylglycine alpha-amidating monooxygenase n=1 Tax=Pendulispora brunnea TaxID=2905690 RepID=A0ABZ2KCL3_9BACT